MKIGQSFRMAIKSLLTSKMRALLTMLGIIIGVAAVIIIVSLGNGMQQYMNAQFEQVGVNLIQVYVYPSGNNRDVEPEDFYQLVEKYPQYLDSVSPYLNASAAVRHGTDEYKHTSVYGVSETLYNPEKNQTVNGEKLKEGRFLSYVDVAREQKVCVIGNYLNQDMFQGKGLGQTLTIGGIPYTVIGVLDQKADSTEGSGDDVVYLPYGLAGQMGGGGMQAYLVTSTSQDTSSAAKGVIERMLYRIYQDEGAYMVMTMSEMMEMMDSMLGVLMTILVIIAAISLVVGGIGIMNIMLVSVTERTREIGIRKSLGAKGKDIRSRQAPPPPSAASSASPWGCCWPTCLPSWPAPWSAARRALLPSPPPGASPCPSASAWASASCSAICPPTRPPSSTPSTRCGMIDLRDGRGWYSIKT